MRWRYVLYALSLPVVIISFVIMSITSDVKTDLQNKEAEGRRVTIRQSASGEFDPQLMTHRLIHWDEEQGVANHVMAARAYGNVSRFLTETKSECHSGLTRVDFLRCASDVLGRNFYYRGSNPVTPAWSEQYSDCDLNVYLMLDAAERAGKKASIVYAPGHAFLAFKDEATDEWLYWETTGEQNRGEQADLTNAFYRKTPQHFYYTPVSSASAEQLYPSLIIKEAGKEKHNAVLSPLLHLYPDNPLLTDRYYRYKNIINDDDAKKIKDLLQTDITSVDKKEILAKYFMDKGQNTLAVNYLNRISDDQCGRMCLSLKQHFSLYYRSIFIVTETLESHGITVTTDFIIASFNSALNTLLMLTVLLIGLMSMFPLLKSGVCKTILKSVTVRHRPGTTSDSLLPEAEQRGSPPSSGPVT